MDSQRQFPAEPDRWYGESPDGEAGRVPDQRYGDDSGRYRFDRTYPPPFDDGGYDDSGPAYPPAVPPGAEQSGRRPTARPARVGKRSGLALPDADVDTAGYEPSDAPRYDTDARYDGDAPRYDTDAPRYDTDAPRYENPDSSRYDSTDGQRYRSEMLDRQALRRPDAPALTDAVIAVPAVEPPRAETLRPDPLRPDPLRPDTQRPETGTTYGSPLQAPTQSINAGPAPTAVYRSRRPGLAAILVIVAVLAELMLAKVLLGGEFAHGGDGADVLGAVFSMAGVPLVAVGLYGLATGAATAGGPETGRAWLRTPLAYLPVGLILIFAAAIAA